MAKEFAKKFYKSKAWLECRAGYIQSVNGLCETCLEKGKVKPGYIVHHIEQLTPENINNPDVTLNWDKLKYECKKCHDKNEGHGVGKNRSPITREGLYFDEEGNLVQSPPKKV